MTEPVAIAEAYIAAWNERSAPARQEKLNAHWAGSAAYRDPQVRVEGLDAIDTLIAGVQERFPGFQFALKPTRTDTTASSGSPERSGPPAEWRRSKAATSSCSPTARSRT